MHSALCEVLENRTFVTWKKEKKNKCSKMPSIEASMLGVCRERKKDRKAPLLFAKRTRGSTSDQIEMSFSGAPCLE